MITKIGCTTDRSRFYRNKRVIFFPFTPMIVRSVRTTHKVAQKKKFRFRLSLLLAIPTSAVALTHTSPLGHTHSHTGALVCGDICTRMQVYRCMYIWGERIHICRGCTSWITFSVASQPEDQVRHLGELRSPSSSLTHTHTQSHGGR